MESKTKEWVVSIWNEKKGQSTKLKFNCLKKLNAYLILEDNLFVTCVYKTYVFALK